MSCRITRPTAPSVLLLTMLITSCTAKIARVMTTRGPTFCQYFVQP